MGIIFNTFKIRGIDVSAFNETIDWNSVYQKGCNFSGIRVGYGRREDVQFKTNWANSKDKTLRMPYWYLDYYSNHDYVNPDGRLLPSNGLSDSAWGKEQANNCWNLIKNDPDCTIVFLDIENGGASYSPPITTVANRVQTIAKAFLEEMDRLNGKFNGIYCSMGLLSWFWTWFRNRPLWVAWYNETQTPTSVLRNAAAYGWTGKCLIWQYASDGDATDDGVGDGVSFGMPYKWLDLNGWVATDEDYALFSNNSTVVVPDPPVDPDPLPNTPIYSVKVFVAGLNVRSSPEILSDNILRVIGYVQMEIYEEKNGFGRISSTNQEWISVNPKYVTKITQSTTSTWVVTSNGLNIRSKPTYYSNKVGYMRYNQSFQVSGITSDGWGALYGREGYVNLKYAKKA